MKVNGIVCPLCESFVYSRAQHDFRWCPCGEVAVDGGQNIDGYVRFTFRSKLPVREAREILCPSSRILFDDWNESWDQFGIIIKKDLTESKIGNITNVMKNIQFVLAVLVAVGEVRAAQKEWSAYDVTRQLREDVNNGKIAISDADLENVDGVDTYRVDHIEVKNVILNAIASGVLTGVKRTHNGQFFVYSEEDNGNVVITPAHVLPIAATVQNLPSNDQIDTYFANLSSAGFDTVTLKQVQSRFKGFSVTCEEYANLLEKRSFTVVRDGDSPSK